MAVRARAFSSSHCWLPALCGIPSQHTVAELMVMARPVFATEDVAEGEELLLNYDIAETVLGEPEQSPDAAEAAGAAAAADAAEAAEAGLPMDKAMATIVQTTI